MNAEGLLANYERIVDAPDAIDQLRRFILNLAVRGKLVPRDAVWQTLNIGDCLEALVDGRFIHQGWSPQCEGHASPDETVWGVLKTTAIQDGFYLEIQNKELPAKLEPKPMLEVHAGDILITCAGPRARCGIVCLVQETRGRLLISGKMYRFRADERFILSKYLVLFLRATSTQATINLIKTGSSESGLNLTLDRFRTLKVSLGTLAEQHRIVAKVDELMALCDELEASRAERETARDALAAASLARLHMPNPNSFQEDACFALDALPALTARPDQVKQLRRTIIDLAVCGRLVEQCPEDGVGSDLLAHLDKARNEVPRGGRGRREAEAGKVSAVERYLDLPKSWTWARVCHVGMTQTGTSPSSSNPDLFGDFIPFVKPADLDGIQVNYEGPGLTEEGMGHSRVAPEHTVLMVCIGATLGKVNTTDRKICFNQQINSVTPYVDDLYVFLSLAFKASGFQKLAWSKAGTGTLPIISKGKWEVLPVPLPPRAEQQRIVAKVDELLALCDRLEASLTTANDTRRRLLDATLAGAIAATDQRLLEAVE